MDGIVVSETELNRTYNFKCNSIEYHRMKLLVKKFLKTYKNGNVFQYPRPTRSTNMQSLTRSKKGSKDFYNVFLSEEFEEPSCKSIWTRKLSSTLNDKIWENIFRACHKSILDNGLIWFQYKILYNILDTKYYLNKLKIIDSNLCSFCNQQPESIEHLFVHCEFVI